MKWWHHVLIALAILIPTVAGAVFVLSKRARATTDAVPQVAATESRSRPGSTASSNTATGSRDPKDKRIEALEAENNGLREVIRRQEASRQQSEENRLKLVTELETLREDQTRLTSSIAERDAREREVRSRARVILRGAAWVTRASGESFLARGLTVELIPVELSRQAMEIAIRTQVAQMEENKKEFPNIWDDAEESKLAKCRKMLENIPARWDAREFFEALRQVSQFGLAVFHPAASFDAIRSSKTDVDGKYEIDVSALPAGNYYLHAMFDSTAGLVEWLVPIQTGTGTGDINLDLDNSNAHNLRG